MLLLWLALASQPAGARGRRGPGERRRDAAEASGASPGPPRSCCCPDYEQKKEPQVFGPFCCEHESPMCRPWGTPAKAAPAGGVDHAAVERFFGRWDGETRTHNDRARARASASPAPRARPYMLVHIPKTGGTNLERMMRKDGPVRTTWGYEARVKPRDRPSRCTTTHVPPAWFGADSPYAGAELFTLVRHPYDRAISQYKWQCWTLGNRVDGTRETREEMQNCIDNVTLMNIHLSTEPQTLGQREHSEDKLAIRPRARRGADCHYVPQVEFTKSVDHVFCTRDEAVSFLREKGLMNDEAASKATSKARGLPKKDHSELFGPTKKALYDYYKEDFALCPGWSAD